MVGSLQHELVEFVGNDSVVETNLMTVLPGLTVGQLMRLNSEEDSSDLDLALTQAGQHSHHPPGTIEDFL